MVFYAESLHQQPQRIHVFVASRAIGDTTQWDALRAKKRMDHKAATGEDYLVFLKVAPTGVSPAKRLQNR